MEVKYIWSSKFRLSTILYLCCRYALVANVLYFLAIAKQLGARVIFPTVFALLTRFSSCDTWYKIIAALSVIGRAAVIAIIDASPGPQMHWVNKRPYTQAERDSVVTLFTTAAVVLNSAGFPRRLLNALTLPLSGLLTARFLLRLRAWEHKQSALVTGSDRRTVSNAIPPIEIRVLSVIDEFGEDPVSAAEHRQSRTTTLYFAYRMPDSADLQESDSEREGSDKECWWLVKDGGVDPGLNGTQLIDQGGHRKVDKDSGRGRTTNTLAGVVGSATTYRTLKEGQIWRNGSSFGSPALLMRVRSIYREDGAGSRVGKTNDVVLRGGPGSGVTDDVAATAWGRTFIEAIEPQQHYQPWDCASEVGGSYQCFAPFCVTESKNIALGDWWSASGKREIYGHYRGAGNRTPCRKQHPLHQTGIRNNNW
ncbi:hypothetical protein EDD85DRAFT_1000206 [Armillaria nabsnona]|nr:hypothetical protein EDD85DRAFT_1000206 [Armillaria nabsnona]